MADISTHDEKKWQTTHNTVNIKKNGNYNFLVILGKINRVCFINLSLLILLIISQVTYNTLLKARSKYGSLHEVQQCLAIYQDMRKAGYVSFAHTHTCIHNATVYCRCYFIMLTWVCLILFNIIPLLLGLIWCCRLLLLVIISPREYCW